MTTSKDNPCELSACIYLLDAKGKKLDFIETVPEVDQFRVREHARKISESIFNCVLGDYKKDYSIKWRGLYIVVEFYKNVSQTFISNIVAALHEESKDICLEKNIKVYKEYPVIFDKFVYTCNRKLGLAKQKTTTYKDYWPWHLKRPIIKEWNMWADDEKSISIRHDTDPIPFAKEIVTTDKIVYFSWGEDDAAVALYSRKGFTVEDVILAIQDLITQEYEMKLGDILSEDDEIGSIDALHFDPRTKHVSISVTFD